MLGRLVSGDSAFQNKFTAEGGDGFIAFASSFPGAIKALNISAGRSMIVQKSAFLASEEGVELSMHFQKKLGSGIFGGEGFIMQKLSGNRIAFIEIDGHAAEYDLSAGQELLVSTGYLAAMEESCTMDVVAVKGAKNMLLGGEGIFQYRCPGTRQGDPADHAHQQGSRAADAVFQQQKIRTDRGRLKMKTKLKLSCLFLAALMLFSLTACGKDNPEPSSTSEGTEQTKPPVEAGSGTTIHTNLWDLTYDEADGWVYEEDDLHDDETSSKIILTLPKEGEDGSIVDAEIRVSVEDPYTFLGLSHQLRL